ncbi:MAG: hybrid sensor histidine kinase/response regulator [Planctomycetes bacterium]|nr:hybrid sensor histidine kinase/response regulator [Planctomycetota bacterium]
MTMQAEQPLKIILVDENEDDLELLALAMRDLTDTSGLDVSTEILSFADPAEAVAELSALDPAVILCSYDMAGGTGLNRLSDFVKADVCPVILLTSHGNEETAVQAIKSGATAYLVKTSILKNKELLHHAVCDAMRRFRRARRNQDLASQLELANGELERKNTILCEVTDTAHRFVDDVAHEFRTPLTVIKEFTSIIGDGLAGPVGEQQAEYLQFITNATNDLAQMVDDFLDSSKLKARTLRVDRRRHRVEDIIDSVWPMLECRAAEKKITVVKRIQPYVDEVFADLEKAGRVIVNLTMNAIKFSPRESEITIWAQPSGTGDVEIGITDQGRGLSADDAKVIFDRFTQVGGLQRSTEKGFGLGLNIAKELIWLNLGSVGVKSELGKGSTFIFTLPTCDPEVIITRSLDLIAGSEPAAPVSVIQSVPQVPKEDIEGLRRFLASVCYPTDLILKAIDGRSIVAMGRTNEPDRWISRIHAAHAALAENNPNGATAPFELRCVGSWSCAQAKETILWTVYGLTMESRCYA